MENHLYLEDFVNAPIAAAREKLDSFITPARETLEGTAKTVFAYGVTAALVPVIATVAAAYMVFGNPNDLMTMYGGPIDLDDV